MQRIAVIGGTGMKQLVAEADFGDSGFTVSQVDSLISENEYGEVPIEVMVLSRQEELGKSNISTENRMKPTSQLRMVL